MIEHDAMQETKSSFMHKTQWGFLFLFTATCTFFYFFNLAPGYWWLPIAAFVAFEYGVVAWSDFHRYHAQNAKQWYISLVMEYVSIGAVTLSTGMQLIKWGNEAHIIAIPTWWMLYGFWGVVIVFPLNLIGLVAIQHTSPVYEEKREQVSQMSNKKQGRQPTFRVVETSKELDTGEIPIYQQSVIAEKKTVARKGPRTESQDVSKQTLNTDTR